MAKFKYTIVRAAIIDEYYEVEADSEQEALGTALDGNLGDPVRTEFADWRDDEYAVVDTREIEQLSRMLRDYAPAPSYFVNESGLKIDVKTGDMYSEQIG